MPAYSLANGLKVASLFEMGFDFTPTLGLKAAQFDALDVDIRSFREPLKRSIQGVIAPSIGKNFIAGGRPTSWTPLSDMTIPVKANANPKFPVEDPLLRSGLLMKTMQQLNIWTISSTEAAIQSLPEKIWYGNVHQSGTNMQGTAAQASGGTAEGFMSMMDAVLAGGSGERGMNIPARPFAMIQTSDLDAIQDVWEIWLNERIIARLGLLCHSSIRTAQTSSRRTFTTCLRRIRLRW
jgi:phage gpG-like protein